MAVLLSLLAPGASLGELGWVVMREGNCAGHDCTMPVTVAVGKWAAAVDRLSSRDVVSYHSVFGNRSLSVRTAAYGLKAAVLEAL